MNSTKLTLPVFHDAPEPIYQDSLEQGLHQAEELAVATGKIIEIYTADGVQVGMRKPTQKRNGHGSGGRNQT